MIPANLVCNEVSCLNFTGVFVIAQSTRKFWSANILVCKIHMCKKIQDDKHHFSKTSET